MMKAKLEALIDTLQNLAADATLIEAVKRQMGVADSEPAERARE